MLFRDIRAYSRVRRSYFFWMTMYYEKFVNPLPELFYVLQKKAKKRNNKPWTLFFSIVIASENQCYDRCYSLCNQFLTAYQTAKNAGILAAVPIVKAFRYHALYERGFYKEAMDGIEHLCQEYQHYAKQGYIDTLYLILTFRFCDLVLLPVYQQTMAWIFYLRACLQGRHKYYDLALRSYTELEKIFSHYRGKEYKYWIARSCLDRGLISRDINDFAQEDSYYNRVLMQYKNDKDILLQCVVSMAGIFKAYTLFMQKVPGQAYAMLDWVMMRTAPPKPDYLQEIFISASVTKTMIYMQQKNWRSNYDLCEKDIKRFSRFHHTYAKRIVAASKTDKAIMLIRMGEYRNAIESFQKVYAEYISSIDITIYKMAQFASYQADFLEKELKRKIPRFDAPYISPLNQWALFSQFANPDLN
jgi:hypothetical protein